MNPIPEQRLSWPSRGIWGYDAGSRYMDISWTGMSKGYDGSNWGDRPFPARLDDIPSTDGGGIYAQANSFIKKLVAPGTKFRFQRDPDGIVYTVEAFNWEGGYNNQYYFDQESGGNPLSTARGVLETIEPSARRVWLEALEIENSIEAII